MHVAFFLGKSIGKVGSEMASLVKLISSHEVTSFDFHHLVASTLVDCHHQLLQLDARTCGFRLNDHQCLLVVYSWCLWCRSSSDFTGEVISHHDLTRSRERWSCWGHNSMYRKAGRISVMSQMGNNHRWTFIRHKTCWILLCCRLHMFDVR